MSKFNVKEVLAKVEIAAKAATKTPEPLTSMLIFHDGKVSCLDGCVECTVNCDEPGIDEPFLVDAEKFIQFLRKLPKDEVDFTTTENSLLLKQGRLKTEFAILPFDDGLMLPTLAGEIEYADDGLEEQFFTAVDACLKTCSDKEAPILGNVAWVEDALVSTDKYAATYAKVHTIPFQIKEDTIAIPGKALRLAAELGGYLLGYMAESGYMYFVNDEEGIVVATNTFGHYPLEVLTFFEYDKDEVKVVEFPPALEEVVGRAEVFVDKKQMNDFVTLSSDGDRLTVRAQSDSGRFEESMRTVGQAFEFPCQPALLVTLGKEGGTAVLDETKLVFTYDEGKVVHSISLR